MEEVMMEGVAETTVVAAETSNGQITYTKSSLPYRPGTEIVLQNG